MVGNYGCTPLSSFSQTDFANSVRKCKYVQGSERVWEGAREWALYIISVTLATSENISQALQGKCKSQFAESSTHTHSHKGHAEKGGKKSLISPFSSIHT